MPDKGIPMLDRFKKIINFYYNVDELKNLELVELVQSEPNLIKEIDNIKSISCGQNHAGLVT